MSAFEVLPLSLWGTLEVHMTPFVQPSCARAAQPLLLKTWRTGPIVYRIVLSQAFDLGECGYDSDLFRIQLLLWETAT